MQRKLKYILFQILIMLNYSFALTQTEAEEYNLKAAFIYNFTNFIEWETTSPGEPFIIGIIGPSLINEPLAEIARTKTVNNKKIIIRKFNTPEEITFCNILFVSQKASFSLNAILSKTATKKILVISEKSGYAMQGTCINFVVINDKLKFETNLNAINASGLKVSSQLLKLAILK